MPKTSPSVLPLQWVQSEPGTETCPTQELAMKSPSPTTCVHSPTRPGPPNTDQWERPGHRRPGQKPRSLGSGLSAPSSGLLLKRFTHTQAPEPFTAGQKLQLSGLQGYVPRDKRPSERKRTTPFTWKQESSTVSAPDTHRGRPRTRPGGLLPVSLEILQDVQTGQK